MRGTLVVGLVLLALEGCASAPAARQEQGPTAAGVEPLPRIKRVRVLADEAGTQVVIMEPEAGKTLIHITGSGSQFDGKVLPYEREDSEHGFRYFTQVHGREWAPVHFEQRYEQTRWLLYLGQPFGREHVVKEDASRSKALRVSELLSLHQRQQASGELAAFQRFDRRVEEQKVEQELAKTRDELGQACGNKPALAVAWKSISDAAMLKYSIASYCGHLLEAARGLCQYQAAKSFMGRFKQLTCRQEQRSSLSAKQGALEYAFAFETPNAEEFYRGLLKQQQVAPGQTLQQQIAIESTNICVFDEKHVAIKAPVDAAHPGLSYGDGSTFVHQGSLPMLGDEWFFDPRQAGNRQSNIFRGYDMRYYASLEADPKTQSCVLTCGTRTTKAKLAEPAQRAAILARATYQPPPLAREPYALARNSRGIYYYVDRGTTPNTSKLFQIYVGPRGRLKLQAMKDIVSDSEGEIFSTQRGDLRLVVSRTLAYWIERDKRQELTWLPVQENLELIYGSLGVYLFKRLGVPCDDF